MSTLLGSETLLFILRMADGGVRVVGRFCSMDTAPEVARRFRFAAEEPVVWRVK